MSRGLSFPRQCSRRRITAAAQSSSPQLIAAVHPTIVVLSLGRHNIFGFPAPEVVDRYRASGARVLRTDLDGAVSVDFAQDPPALTAYNKNQGNL